MAPILSGYGDSVFLALIYRPLFLSMRKKERKSEMGFFFVG
jgi:hypothetical protein